MQPIRRNTKKYKNIQEVLLQLAARTDRQNYVKIYFVEPGKSLNEKIDLEQMGEGGYFYYDMNYNNILSGLKNNNLTLFEAEDNSGLFFFRDRNQPQWDQIPFRLPAHSLESPEAFLQDLPPAPAKKPVKVTSSKNVKQEKSKPSKSEPEKPKPLFELKHEIEFTGLEDTILQQPQVTKKDLLQYYYDNGEALLPIFQNRPLMVKRNKDKAPVLCTLENFKKLAACDWLKTNNMDGGEGAAETYILCQNMEHLLLLVEHVIHPHYYYYSDEFSLRSKTTMSNAFK